MARGLGATVTTSVATGQYYARVEGVGSRYYSDYASIGSYTMAQTGCTSAATAPDRPTGLSAYASADGTTVTVRWSPPSDDGDSPVTGYRVTRTGAAPVDLGVTGSYTWTGLTPGTYTFGVAAINASGVGPEATRNLTTISPPGAPAGLSAISSPDGTSVTVTWSPPTDQGGSAVNTYRVSRSGAISVDLSATSTGYTWTGLTPGATYTFGVAAANAAGLGTAATVDVTTTFTPGLPAQPSGLTVVAAADGRSATATWSAPGDDGGSAITGYRVSRSGAAPVDLGVTGTYTWSGLTPGTAYTFGVGATNGNGHGPAATRDVTTPVAAPDAPAVVTVDLSVDGTSATVTVNSLRSPRASMTTLS